MKEYCFRTFVQGKRSVRIVNHVYKKFGMQEHLSSGAFVPCHPGIVGTACTRMKRGRRCFASSALSQLLSCALAFRKVIVVSTSQTFRKQPGIGVPVVEMV